MAYNTIYFRHHPTGKPKEAPVGFSWTTLFFGFFVPLLRKDLKWFAIMLIAQIFTLGISVLVFPFIYNKIYIKSLISEGYQAHSIKGGSIDHLATALGIAIPAIMTTEILRSAEASPEPDKTSFLEHANDIADAADTVSDVIDLFGDDEEDED